VVWSHSAGEAELLGVAGLREWDDTGILAQVLATSQQEYIDDLKKRSQLHPDDRPGPSHAGLAPSDCEAGPSTR